MFVCVRNGATRHVLLVGSVAIKVTRVGFISLIYSTYRYLFQRIEMEEKIKKYVRHRGLASGIKNYLGMIILYGRHANIQEHRLSIEYPELPFAKVLGIYCFGTILVMERGVPVSSEESLLFRQQFPNAEFRDMPHHTCLINGEFKIIDYGNIDDLVVLPN